MKKSIIFLTTAFIALFPLSAKADDSGSWLSVQVNKGWERSYAFARIEQRSFNDFSDIEARFLSVGYGLKISKWLKTDLSYEYWSVNPDISIHKAVLCNSASITRDGLSVSIREKLEFSVNPDASGIGVLLRSRLRAQYAIPGSIFRPYAMAETFNWESWIRSLYYVGTEFNVGAHSMLDVFYLYHVPAASVPVHILGVGYFFNF